MNPLLLGLIAGGLLLAAESARRRPAYATAIGAAIALVALRPAWNVARTYADNGAHFQIWDFLCFWLYGRSLALHLDPYSAQTLGTLPLPATVDAVFRREVLAVGVPYPPWSLALFQPLGMFSDPHRAALLWSAVEFAALLAACVVIARWKAVSLYRIAVIAALVLWLPPTMATAILSQTIPLALLFLALYVLRIDRADGGVWLAAAAVVKPFLLLLLLVPLARGTWRQLVAALATLTAMSVLGAMLAKPAIFMEYVRANPIARMPGALLTEDHNVPIVAYVMRWMHVVAPNGATLPPAFLTLDLVLLAAGLAVGWLALERDPVLAFCALLTSALLVSPQISAHYAVLLALPLFVLWRHRLFVDRQLGFSAIVCAVFVLLAIDDGRQTMFASLLVWIVCAAACVYRASIGNVETSAQKAGCGLAKDERFDGAR